MSVPGKPIPASLANATANQEDGNGIFKANRFHATLPLLFDSTSGKPHSARRKKIGNTSFQFKGELPRRTAVTFMNRMRATRKERVLMPLGQVALGQYNQDMKNAKPAYVVYNPPVHGSRFLRSFWQLMAP